MLLSGLWKLAAMTGVIGVGLVAVYQAQQGMEQTSITAAEADTGDSESDDAGAVPASDIVAPQSESDPFNKDAETLLGTQPSSNLAPDGATPTLAAPAEFSKSDGFGATDNNDLPTGTNSVSVPVRSPAGEGPPRSGPGLDFRADTANVAEADAAPGKIAIQPVAFEEDESAERLPDDLDAFEADVKKAAERAKLRASAAQSQPAAVKPFVRQNADFPKELAADPASAADPFEANEASAKSAAPAVAQPMAEEQPGADAFDPFEADTPAAAAPAKKAPELPADLPETPKAKTAPTDEPQPEADPFADFPPAKGAAPPATPSLGSPQDVQPAPVGKAPASPAGDSLSSPFAADEPPAKTTPDPAGDLLDSAPPAGTPGRNKTLPKLPTEVPDSFDNGFPGEPSAPRTLPGEPDRAPVREPLPDRRTLPDKEPPPARRPLDDQPKIIDGDLLGDGTVTPSSPRGVQQARLSIEKIAPQQATLGEPLVYSVIIKNIGGNDAHHVVVEDRIPKGTELTGTAPRAEMVDKKLIWRIGTLKAGEEKKISIRVIPRQEGSIGSVARVNFATEVAAEIIVAAPQLSFTAKAPRQARMGETLEMTFLLKNTGAAPATNVSVRDIVPPGLKHEAASDIECPIGKLAPNETREIVLSVTAVKPGKATNRAILTGDGGISQELETTIEIIGEQLVLTRSGQNRIYVDRPVVFTNNIRNDGNADVKQVRIAEVVPAGMELLEASDGGRFDPAQRAIVWDLGVLPAGAETAVSSKLVARTTGTLQAKVTATGPAGSIASVKADVDVVGRPELQIETVSRTGVVAVGDRLTSKIQLKNHGSAPANNVSLNIRLPRELKLVEVRGGQYSLRDNVIAFETVNAIGPKETAAFELVMEAVAEADAQMNLEISADHLSKPARRSETVQIAAEIR